MGLFSKPVKKEANDELLTREQAAALQNKHAEIMAQFRSYRDNLQRKYDELAERERQVADELAERERQIEIRQQALQTLEVKKIESLKMEIARLTEMEQSLRQSIHEHCQSMFRAENRSLQYMKRLDNKEQSVIEELTRLAEKSEKYGAIVPNNGYEFEEYVADILRGNGFENVRVTNASHDYGADVVAEKDDIVYVFQCKYYSGLVGIEAVQQVFLAKEYYQADIAAVITNNFFTTAAKNAAKETKVKLYDGERLEQLRKRAFGANEGSGV